MDKASGLREPPYVDTLTLIARLMVGKIAQPTMSWPDTVLVGVIVFLFWPPAKTPVIGR